MIRPLLGSFADLIRALAEPDVDLEVHGRPAPQGSKKVKGRIGQRARLVESSERVKPWRSAVHIAGLRLQLAEPLDGPLAASMVFTMPKPVGAPKRRRTWQDRYPDLSKLVRSTEDALTTAGVWADDARVVEYVRLAKVFPGEDRDALDQPGVRIRIARLPDAVAQAAALAAGLPSPLITLNGATP